jgi:hypothetical protein
MTTYQRHLKPSSQPATQRACVVLCPQLSRSAGPHAPTVALGELGALRTR